MKLLYVALLLLISPGFSVAQSLEFRQADSKDIVLPLPAEAYIRDWLVAGPYPAGSFTEGQPVPEEWKLDHIGATGSSGLPAITGKLGWRPLENPDGEYNIDLVPKLSPNENCAAYFACHIWSPSAQSRRIYLGSDDGIAVWLNGKLLHEVYKQRASVPDEDVVTLNLQAGWNPLIIKVTQGGLGWRFVARLNDNAGLRFSADGKSAGITLISRAELEGRGESLPVFEIRPYLQNISSDAVTILWQTDRPAKARITVSGPNGTTATHITSRLRRLEEVRITGLQPGSTYRYSVSVANTSNRAGDIARGASYTFRTFESNPEFFRIAVTGDSRSEPERFRKVVDAMLKHPGIDLVLHSGDFIGNGRNWSEWIPQYFEPAAHLISHLPVMGVLGNHENNADYYYQYFDLPGNEQWWSKRIGPIHIVGLDSNVDFHEGTKQYNWMIETLDANKDARWKMIMLHHPAYTSGPHGRLGDDGLPVEYGVRTALRILPDICKQYGIPLVIAGHDHLYERSYNEGVHYIIAGGGGAPTYKPSNPQKNQFSQMAYSDLSYLIFSMGQEQATVEAYGVDGKLLEAFSIP